MHTIKKALITACATAFIAGCGGDSRVTNAELSEVPPVNPVFSPSQSKLPFPTDILFSGTPDGALNVPGQPNTESSDSGLQNPASTTVLAYPNSIAYGQPRTALNTMDGFGTTSNATMSFTDAVRGDTLEQGIHVYKASSVDAATKTVTGIDSKLTFGVDYVLGNPGGTAGLVIPLQPLDPATTYLIAVTSDVLAVDGDPVVPSDEYSLVKLTVPLVTEGGTTPCDYSNTPTSLAACDTVMVPGLTLPQAIQLEPLRRQTEEHEAVLDAQPDVSKADIAMSFSFTTQNIGGALAAAKTAIENASPPGFVAGPAGASPGGAANMFSGQMTGVQQILNPDVTAVAAYKYGSWVADDTVWGGGPCQALPAYTDDPGNPPYSENFVPCNGFTPEINTTDNLPVLISVPNSGSCTAPYSVVIFQHGITSNRGALMGIADALAAPPTCSVGVAIDLPKHGIQPTDPTFGGLSQNADERLIQPGATTDCQNPSDSVIDSSVVYCKSGDYYINLESLPNARDTIRQSVVDLHSLYHAIVNSGGTLAGASIDTADVHFAGMSLGAIVGSTFVAQQPAVQTASLNVGAGGIAKVLDGSPTFEPVVTAGLQAAAGINKPSGDYEAFLLIAQTLLDNTDPMNFAETIAGAGTPVLYQEVVGETQIYGVDCSSVSCPDQVLPNNVFGQSGLTEAWNASTFSNQITHLPNQAPLTQPVALSGTDPLTQGTAFLANAQNGILDPLSTALPLDLFYGLNLPQVDSSGGSGSGVVRFTAGTHSSLLDPTPSGATTQLMQTQIATFVATGGTTVAADPNAGGAGQVVQD